MPKIIKVQKYGLCEIAWDPDIKVIGVRELKDETLMFLFMTIVKINPHLYSAVFCEASSLYELNEVKWVTRYFKKWFRLYPKVP